MSQHLLAIIGAVLFAGAMIGLSVRGNLAGPFLETPTERADREAGAEETVPDAVPAPATQSEPPADNIDGENEWRGQMGQAARDIVIRVATDAEWMKMWELAGSEPPGPLPRSQAAVGIFLGQRSSGGYGIEITGIQETADALQIAWRELRPPPGAMRSMVITQPWLIRLVPAGRTIMFEQQPAAINE